MKKDKERLEKISEDKERKDKEQGKQDEKANEEKWGKLEGNDWKQNLTTKLYLNNKTHINNCT